jgi:hypothetical protein
MENQELLTLGKEQAKPITPELDAEQGRQWEKNHKKIVDYINLHLMTSKDFPTVGSIAECTKLSRVTVRKHIRDFYTMPESKDQVHLYRFMATNIMKKLYIEATCGRVRSARLFMELIGFIKTGQMEVNNNFIGMNQTLKVNDIELTEELLQSMSKENKDKLVELLKEAKDGNPLRKIENT